MQLDPAAGPRQPFPHEFGVMIARVVQIDMNEQPAIGQAISINSSSLIVEAASTVFDLDHPGLAGFEVNRAVDVDALTPARLFDRELVLSWPTSSRPAAPRAWDALRRRKQRPHCPAVNSTDCHSSR